jgi:HEAT repeat protein
MARDEGGNVNEAQVTNGSPTPASVQAYEEDWYRSLRALAERRRSELEQVESEEDEAATDEAVEPAPPTSPVDGAVDPVTPTGVDSTENAAAAPDEPAAGAIPDRVVDPFALTPPDLAARLKPAEPGAEPTAAEATAPEPTAPEPTAPEPTAPEFGPAEPRVAEPSAPEPSAEEPPPAQPEAMAERSPIAQGSPIVKSEFRRVDPFVPPRPAAATEERAVDRPPLAPEPEPVAEPRVPAAPVRPEPPVGTDAAQTPSADLPTSVRPSDVEPRPEVQVEQQPEQQPEPQLEPQPEPPPLPQTMPQAVPQPVPGPGPAGPSLRSRDPAERREALLALGDHEPTHDELEAAASLMLDPDAEIRTLALHTLARYPGRLESATIRQALQDPADEVRALAVRVAASRGPQDVGMLMPLVGARGWPDTQKAVLEILPSVLALAAPEPEELDPLLSAVAELDPPPHEWEREAFAKVAGAIGTAPLIDALTLPDLRRLGAVRLLSEDRSQTVREALAVRAGDPIDEIRRAGTAAVEELARAAAPSEPEQSEPKDISTLARSVRDDAPAEVEAALSALAEIPREDVVEWAKAQLASSDPDAVIFVAGVAVVLCLHEIATPLLEQTAALSAERRRTVVDVLAEFPEPDDLAVSLTVVALDRRPEAVRVVWQAAGRRVAPRLRFLLADPSSEVRVAVVDVLGQSGDPASIEKLAGLVSTDTSPDVRAAAVRAIARAGAEIDEVTRALQDGDASVRAAAVRHLPADPADRIGPILAEALADGDGRVRHAAMERLAGVSSADRQLAWSAVQQVRPEERSALLEAFVRNDKGLIVDIAFEHLHSSDEDERALAIETVGWGASQASVEAAIRALGDPTTVVRRVAAGALGRLRDRSAVAALGNALGDPDAEVRSGAIRALGVIDDEAVLSYLVAALQDPDQSVRETASHVLTGWSSPAVAKRLAGVLTVPSLRESATDLLLRIGPTSVELLIDVLRQGTPELRGTVGPLLNSLVGVGEFVRRMDSLEPDRRLRAAEALGAIGGPEAVDTLVEALSDPDEHVRQRAAQLLGALGDARTAPAVAGLLDDPVPEVVAAAREALETRLNRRSNERNGDDVS